jgi:SecD/SecF fusion protein
MVRLVKESRIGFMGLAPKALVGSLILIVGGVGLFISLEDKDKLSIDFLGGFTLTARTEAPQPVDDIRDLVRTIPGTIGESVEVKPILKSQAPDGGFTQFRLTYKAEVDGTVQAAAQAESGETGEGEIREALAGVLQKGPVELEVNNGAVSGRLYFEESHSEDDVRGALAEIGLTEVQASASGTGATSVFAFSGQAQPDQDGDILSTLINGKFKNRSDSAEQAYRLASPIPESSVVGAQVVGELRDKAIFAILVSLFAVVLYIRARFAEYSYGFAAVVALVHDVLITLGCLALAIMTDLVEAEISLPMIAAFLTIIGYSLNDTIVVFDRVRENKPRMAGSLAETLNTSINQTLSRTVLTSITTLLTVMILLAFNFGTRNVLEGFAFALTIGVLVGTYSSMFVACPTLLWLENRAAAKEAASAAN